jgi:hypothetical protein
MGRVEVALLLVEMNLILITLIAFFDIIVSWSNYHRGR